MQIYDVKRKRSRHTKCETKYRGELTPPEGNLRTEAAMHNVLFFRPRLNNLIS